jgi:hypothetical protein
MLSVFLTSDTRRNLRAHLAILLFKRRKGKGRPRTRHQGPGGGVEVHFYSFFNLGVRWGVWSKPRPGRFTPEKDPDLLYRRLCGP